MSYVSWRLRSIPSLVHSIKSPRRFLSILCQTVEDNTVYTDVIEVISIFFFFLIIITVEPRLLELWEETKSNSS